MIIGSIEIKKIIMFQIFLNMFLRFFVANYGLTYAVYNLSLGIFLVLCFIGYYYSQRFVISLKFPEAIFFRIIILIFILEGIISFLINGNSIRFFSMGLINHLHFFLFFLICVRFLSIEDVNKVCKFIVYLVFADAVIMTYQYFAMGLRQDFLGGLFGNTQGCNGIQNVVSCVGLIYLLTRYIYGKMSSKILIVYMVVTCYMAAIAELTVYYGELMIILLLAVMLGKTGKYFSWRKVALAVGGVIAFVLGVYLLIRIFPTKVRFLELSNIMEYLGGYESTGVYRISRLNAVQQMADIYLQTISNKIAGLGPGYTVSGTEFYNSHSIIQYGWFASAVTMLELGYIGVIGKLASFVVIFYSAHRLSKKYRDSDDVKQWVLISRLCAVLCIVLFFYNNTLEDYYSAYLLAFLLSSSAIARKDMLKNGERRVLLSTDNYKSKMIEGRFK